MNPDDMRALLEAAEEPIVIIDTIRNLLRFEDENDNSEVARKLTPGSLWPGSARRR